VIPLIKALRDPREGVRRGVVESLGRLGDKRAVAALERQRKIEETEGAKLAMAMIDMVLQVFVEAANSSRNRNSGSRRLRSSTRRPSSPKPRFRPRKKRTRAWLPKPPLRREHGRSTRSQPRPISGAVDPDALVAALGEGELTADLGSDLTAAELGDAGEGI
jgi:hypothetical protein